MTVATLGIRTRSDGHPKRVGALRGAGCQVQGAPPRLPREPIWPDSAVSCRACCVDIATGNGQAAIPLAASFKRVIGIDGSPAQVAQAPPVANIEFRLGTAEATGVEVGSVDLVTVLGRNASGPHSSYKATGHCCDLGLRRCYAARRPWRVCNAGPPLQCHAGADATS